MSYKLQRAERLLNHEVRSTAQWLVVMTDQNRTLGEAGAEIKVTLTTNLVNDLEYTNKLSFFFHLDNHYFCCCWLGLLDWRVKPG